MGLIDQAVEKVGDLGGDDLVVNAIIRAAKKQGRLNNCWKSRVLINESPESKSITPSRPRSCLS